MTGEVEILSASMALLGKKAVILLRETYGKPDRPFQNRLVSLAPGRIQKYVDIVIDERSMNASVEEITERFLRPMAAGLAQSLPRDVAFVPLELPSGCQAARQTWDDVSLRLTTGWRPTPIFDDEGEIVGYDEDVPILRMDVMVTTEATP